MRLPLIVLVAMLAIGAVSARAAHGFFPSLNDPHPPLAEAAPFHAPASKPLARRVVLIVIDGLRLDASRGLPALDGLRARGTDTACTTA